MDYNFLAGAGASLIILYYLVSFISTKIEGYNFSRANGCQPPVRFPQSERILGLGFVQNMRQAIKDKRLLEVNCGRHERVGHTFTVSVMGKFVVVSRDPEVLKAILSSQFKDFGLGSRYEMFKPLLGLGIFTADGAHWEHSRALVRPNFVRNQVADLGIFEEHIQSMIARIPRDGSTIDLQPLFFSLTLDSATEFLFGTSVNSLGSEANSSTQYFGKCFDIAMKTLSSKARMMPLLHSKKEFLAACKVCRDYVDDYIEKAVDLFKPGHAAEKSEKKPGEKYVFLDELAKLTDDPASIRDELMNILVAGRDTTASLLSNTFHVIARRPDIWAKLQEEIDTLNGEKPTYETLRGMRYLKFVLNESLRLYPVVPGNARYAIKNTTIPRGGGPDGLSPMFIAKGAVVSYSVWSMHRRKDIYGPDADDFRPERWATPADTMYTSNSASAAASDLNLTSPSSPNLNATSDSTDTPTDTSHSNYKFNPNGSLRPGWGYLPFNGGPRICVGQQFALTEASYTIVRLLQEFKGIEARDDRPWVEQLALTVACANGVHVALEGR